MPNRPELYTVLLAEVKARIRSAQYAALRAVNQELIHLYWDIGRLIVARQAGETFGRSIVETLATDLQTEFPGISGFSVTNLYRMKQFYEAYPEGQLFPPLVGNVNFTCAAHRSSDGPRTVLIHQIENQTYQKTALAQNNFDRILPEEIRKQAKLAVKDEYTFDFWN